MVFFTQKKFSEWSPCMAAWGPVLAVAEQQCSYSFFIVMLVCLKGLGNFGLGLQFNMTYNLVWQQAAAESRIWVVMSWYMIQTDVRYTKYIKICFLPRILYTHGIKSFSPVSLTSDF